MRVAAFSSVVVFSFGLASYAEGPTFDVASVKLADPEVRPPYTITGGPDTSDPSRFNAPHIGMLALLRRAFDVSEDQIKGPVWLGNDPPYSAAKPAAYSVLVTMPPGTTKEQFQRTLQSLLVERFHLVFHRETRNFPGYELVVDKGGQKFKEVIPTQGANPDADRDPQAALTAPRGDDGFPTLPGSRVFNQNRPDGQVRWKFQERTMAEFISNLEPLIGASQGKSVLQGFPLPRVADKTGLTGKYSFILEFYDASMANLPGLFRRAGIPSDTSNGSPAASEPGGGLPDIFVAVQKQLGLRLDKTADVPLDLIVVDSVDKVPTAN